MNHSQLSQGYEDIERFSHSRFLSQSKIADDQNDPSYPFGRDSVKIANYVSSQMKHSIDEQNKRVLDKFRLEAIKHRNQRVMKHLGRIPYLTQSMVPGMNINPLQFIEKPPQPVHHLQTKPAVPYAPTLPIMHNKKNQQINGERVMIPRTMAMKKSVGVEAKFEEEFPLAKKKRNHKSLYTIENYEQQLAFDKISTMLSQINKKIEFNSKILSDSMVKDKQKRIKVRRQKSSPRPNVNRQRFWTQAQQNPERPTISYTNELKRIKTQVNKRPTTLQDHLKLLKSKRKRMNDLDEGIIRMRKYQ